MGAGGAGRQTGRRLGKGWQRNEIWFMGSVCGGLSPGEQRKLEQD